MSQPSQNPPSGSQLSDVLATEELARRPNRQPDLAAENRILRHLAVTMAQRPADLLQELMQAALEHLKAGSVGISLIESDGSGQEYFRWVAVSGVMSAAAGGSSPRYESPCGITLAPRTPQLFLRPERYFRYLEASPLPILEGIVIPFPEGTRPDGTIWLVSHDPDRKFDAEDARMMTTLADFTISALQTARLDRQHREAEALRESERLFAAFFHRSVVGLAKCDLQGRLRMVNDRYCEMVGRWREDLLDRRVQDLRHPEDRERLDALLNSLTENLPHSTITTRVLRPDGSTVWIRSEVSALAGKDGKPDGFLLANQDVTFSLRLETRDRLLISIDDATRMLTEPEAILSTALQLMRQHLDTDRIAYAEVDADQNTYSVLSEDSRVPLSWVPSPRRLGNFSEALHRCLLEGRPFTFEDVEQDDRTRPIAAKFLSLGVRSLLSVPVHRGGRLSTFLSTYQSTPRKWSSEEAELLQRVAIRCWESIERIRITRNLAESEDRYRKLFDSLEDGFCVVEILLDAEGRPADYRFLEYNPAFEKHTGLYDARGKTVLELVPTLDPWWIETYGRVALTGQPERFEESAEAMDHRRFEVYTFRIGLPEKRNVGIFFKNVTERRRAEARDRFQVQLNEATLPLTDPDAIALAAARLLVEHLEADRSAYIEVAPDEDLATIVGDYSPSMSSIRGQYSIRDYGERLSADLRANRTFVEPDFERSDTPDLVRQRYAQLSIRSVISQPLHKKGRLAAVFVVFDSRPRRWTQSDIDRVRLAAQHCWEAIERASVSRNLHRSEEALREADRRKNEFLAMLAHELRNPLAPLRNAANVLRQKSLGASTLRSASEMMERQVGQMTRLVDDLLDVSRVSRGRIELRLGRLELASVVLQAAEAARPQYQQQGIDFEVRMPQEHLYVDGDPTRLAQAVGNLLSNAAKFTNAGGLVQLTVAAEEDQAVIRVTDSGIGIAPDQLSRIFELFAQVDTSLERTQSGLGIGLTLVRQLAELHGGSVTAASAGLGRGSEFLLRLPLTSAPEPPIVVPSPHIQQTASLRILVVDDNQDSAESLALLLDFSGHQVQTAFDGPEALVKADSFRPEAILLDIGLPGMNGHEVCRRLRAQAWGRDIRIAALTGWGQEDDRLRSTEAGFDAHFVKPADPALLTSFLAQPPPRTSR